MNLLSLIENSIWFILPTWCANISLVIFSKIISSVNIKDPPLDMNKKLFKQRILGDSVTIYGLVVSFITGTIVGLSQNRIIEGGLLGIGAYIGNACGSFIKRRFKMKSGTFFPVLDHIDHTAFSLLIVQPKSLHPTEMIITILLLTVILHPIVCIIGYFLKIKKVPW